MTLGLTTLELASAAFVEGAIWTLGTVMPKIAFCTIERQWQSGRKLWEWRSSPFWRQSSSGRCARKWVFIWRSNDSLLLM